MTVISISDNELLPSERVSIAVITLSKCESVTFLDFQINLNFGSSIIFIQLLSVLILSLIEILLKLLYLSPWL